MNHRIKVTTLVENTAGRRDLLAEHGLAFWIECGTDRVLFDTGQGRTLLHNARSLGAVLQDAGAVVVSHGHYDHTGGLDDVLRVARRASVHAHPAAFEPKYARNDDQTCREIGSPISETRLRRRAGELILTSESVELFGWLRTTGQIPRTNDFEDTGGPFFLDGDCRRPDPLLDDQAIFFESAAGTVVLLGCAHAGVINTLEYVRELTGGAPIHAVMGGMHLGSASPDRLARTIEALRGLGVERLGPAHCTGMAATVKLWSAFPGRCFACNAGTAVECAPPSVAAAGGGRTACRETY